MSSEFEGLDYCDKDVYESEGFDYESCLPCSPYPSPPLLLSPQMLRKHRARKFFQPPLPPLPPLPPRLCLNCSSAQVTQVYLQPAKMCTEHSRVRGHEYSRRDRERRKRLIEQDQRKQRAQQGAFKDRLLRGIENYRYDHELIWTTSSQCLDHSHTLLNDALTSGDLQSYVTAFGKNFTTWKSLFSPGCSFEDMVLLNFWRNLLVAVQQGRAINVQDINRLVRNLELQGGSPHHTVVWMYWGSFLSELCNCTTQRDSESVVRRYIICSLWSAYWEQREHVKPFNNWKEAKKVLLRTTMEIVELRSREKWEKMKDIRDRFLFRREYVAAVLESSNHDISEVITGAFNTSQTTWNCGLKGIADNIKHGSIPTGSEGAAVLILAWAIDSQKSSDICSLTVSPEFYRALEQWKSVANDEVLKFIDFCWPCCEDCKWENISTPPDAKEDTDLQMLFKSVTDYFAAPSDSTKDVARNILFDCMNSDDSDIFGSDISLEACVIDVALELEDPESIHTLSATSPHVHDSVRPPEDPAQPNDVKYGICTNLSLFGGALLIGVIIAQFLTAIHVLGFTPLLLLWLLPFDRASCFGDILHSYATASSKYFSFFKGNGVKDIIDRVRDGDLSTMQDVERELLGIVEIGAIEAVLRYCAACSSQLEKLKLSPCGDEDEGIPSQSFSSTGTDIPIPDQDAGGEAPDLVSGELQPAILPDISLWTPVPDIPVLDQFVNESPERSTAEISSARTPEPPVAHDIPVQSLFGCRHCSKSFTSASNRRRHERSAHSGTVACRYCNKHIINRADNKRGHAKVCRVSPRNMF